MKAAAKSSLGLLGAAVVAGALGLYAWFGVMKPDEREAEQKAVDERLISVAGAQGDGGATVPSFTRLTVTSGAETTTLERRGDVWFLTSPVQSKADPTVVSALLRQLETGNVKEQLEPRPSAEDLARYGLQPPKFSVRAAADAGEFTIEGGIENPFDGSVFVRKTGSEAVYSASGVLRASLAKSTFDLRDKQVLSLPAEDVASIEVKLRQGGFTLVQESGAWRLTAPKQASADRDAVSAMLSSLASERATAFPADTPEVRKLLEKPSVTATVRLASGGETRLRLGGEGGVLYALREQDGSPPVLAQVNPSAATHLTKTFEALRDKTALKFDREAVARIVLHGPGEPLELVRDAADAGATPSWRLTKPESGAAQAWKVSSLLWSLSSLQGESLVEENARNLRPYGLEKPARRIELFAQDGTSLATLAVGGEVKGAPDRVYVLNGAGTVLDVEKSRLGELPAAAADLLEKSPDTRDAGLAQSSPD